MFDLSWSELLVIAIVAIVVVGPKDLPRALRAVGQWAGKARRMAREFQNQFNEAIREAEIDSIKKEVESVSRIDPMAEMRKQTREIEAGLKSAVKSDAPRKSDGDREMAALSADTGTEEPAPQPVPDEPAKAATDVKA